MKGEIQNLGDASDELTAELVAFAEELLEEAGM